MALAPKPLGDEPEVMLASSVTSCRWIMATLPSAPILGGLQVG